MTFPLLARAIVLAQDQENYGLMVSPIGILGGQSPVLGVKVLTHGPRDAVRGDFPELPARGTHGVVVFPSGDGRNGIWIGAAEPALNDASPNAAGQKSPRYRAHYAGGWHWTGPDGTTCEVLADGSYLLSGTALPSPTRHTVDGQGKRQRTVFTQSQRNPSPPGPYPASFVHKSGARVAFTAGGAVTAAAASGQSATVSANGGSLTVDASGGITLATASGQPLTLSANGASVVIDASGNITLTDAVIGAFVNLAGGFVTVGTGGATQFVKLASGANSTVLKAQ